MDKQEIEKLIYKLNPTARLYSIEQGVLSYKADLVYENVESEIYFAIPTSELEDLNLSTVLPAIHLIKWIE